LPDDIDASVFLFEDGPYADRIRMLGLPVYIVPASRQLMSVSRSDIRARYALDGLRYVFRLARLLRSVDVDVAVTNSMKAHVAGAIAARLCGVPVVTWLKDLPEGLALKLVRLVSQVCAAERIGCSRAVVRRLDLPHSTALAPAIDVVHGDPSVAPGTAKAQLGLPPEKLIFSMVGRIARTKGQDAFIKAAARVIESNFDNVHFAIVGSPTFPRDQEFVSELVDLTTQLNITRRISFIPWLDDPSIAYAASDLLCNASSAEAFGRTSVEAGLYGVPVLCFDDGGAGEAVVPHVTGTVVPAGDVTAFAAAMAGYAADPSSLRRAGAAAKVYAQRNNADLLASSFFEIVRRASARRRRYRAAQPRKAIPKGSVPVAAGHT